MEELREFRFGRLYILIFETVFIFFSNNSIAEKSSKIKASMTHRVININNDRDGMAQEIQIKNAINQYWDGGLVYEKLKKFGLKDENFGFENSYKRTGKYAINGYFGFSENGSLLAYFSSYLEFYLSLQQGLTLFSQVQYKNFSMLRVMVFSTGMDIEKLQNLILITRVYFSKSNYKSDFKNQMAGAFLIKPIYSLNENISAKVVYSSGKELALINNPLESTTLKFENYGFGFKFNTLRNVNLNFDYSMFKYSKINYKANEYSFSVEALW